MKTLCILFAILFVPYLYAEEKEDWNQWRGANRTGIFAGFAVPESLPEKLTQVWKIDVGVGHSSPVISGKTAFLLSRVSEDEVVAAYDLETGKLIWKDSYSAPYTMNPAAIPHGKGPKSTPLVAQGKLFTFGISGILSAYDANKGILLWRNDFTKEFPVTVPDFGTAMSPALDNGLLIVHAGGPGKGSLMALDPNTGKTKWRWDGDGPAYASPIVVSIGGVRQIVTQTQKYIVGISAGNGSLLWQIPFETEYEQNAVTPAVYKDLLIFSGLNKGAFAIKPLLKDGKWTLQKVWQNERGAMYLNSPVVIGDYVYGMTHFRKGQYFCLDARTGTTIWTSTGAEGENAAIVSSADLLFFLSNNAELTIAKTGTKYEVLKKYTVAQSPTWAHPALTGNQILVKDLKSLSLWSLQ
jgi:outer membrane protein assembly factor BamB